MTKNLEKEMSKVMDWLNSDRKSVITKKYKPINKDDIKLNIKYLKKFIDEEHDLYKLEIFKERLEYWEDKLKGAE